MSQRTQLYCAWSAIPMVLVGAIGLFGGGLIPPISPQSTTAEVSAFYNHNTNLLRLGLLVALFAFALWGFFVAAIGTQLRRIPNVSPVLARAQTVAGSFAWAFLVLPLVFFSAAAYRPDRDPDVLTGMNDLAWITLVMPIMPFITQAVAVGVAVLQDGGERPVLPRWYGYFTMWYGLLLAPGGLVTFFQSGPFDWGGLFALWVPLVVFGVWIAVTAYVLDRAIRSETPGPVEVEDRSAQRTPTRLDTPS